ncbi:hypothetical protein GDO81_024757 [Engystomops pustulosus]|uniref:Uncharacterized protein n=1 Tax=Engystomops pustulosus TaxID=76066 RepID=A0AAV6Z7Z1_ENGPU|nr:hypothetical protein GDO81_024757 [Engystomops pustulosus]
MEISAEHSLLPMWICGSSSISSSSRSVEERGSCWLEDLPSLHEQQHLSTCDSSSVVASQDALQMPPAAVRMVSQGGELCAQASLCQVAGTSFAEVCGCGEDPWCLCRVMMSGGR